MTPYAADEATLRMRAQRTPFVLAPIIPVLIAVMMLTGSTITIWNIIALVAVSASVASFMRLLWMTAHFKDYARTQEFRVLKAVPYAAIPATLVALLLNFLF